MTEEERLLQIKLREIASDTFRAGWEAREKLEGLDHIPCTPTDIPKCWTEGWEGN